MEWTHVRMYNCTCVAKWSGCVLPCNNFGENNSNIILFVLYTVPESNSTTTAAKTPEIEGKSLSSHSSEESPGTPPAPASPVIDADLARMEALLDNWCLDLKRNVLVS